MNFLTRQGGYVENNDGDDNDKQRGCIKTSAIMTVTGMMVMMRQTVLMTVMDTDAVYTDRLCK